jgi:hypothetical protein
MVELAAALTEITADSQVDNVEDNAQCSGGKQSQRQTPE